MEMLAENRLDAVGVLSDPRRHQLYRLVAASDRPLSRDQAAEAAGMPRSTAALHLDRLVEAGLLTVERRRLTGRSGPGAGRPTKLYRATQADVIASVPERHYELAGELLAAAIERAERDAVSIRNALDAEAHETGLKIGRSHASLEGALTGCGYAPADDGAGGFTLENCPFHVLASRHTPLVCGANLALLQGVVEATGDERMPALEPASGRCCVAIRPPSEAIHPHE
ncbi:helix-turn-helix transcriptional regulator [Microbacterium deminutum]|uniref:Helix-turn-helix domain-containing protein n=1 Tax=Microbacterium deminutum TaxID=344164 RepID=A0ABN2RBJ5_9MICO